MISSIGSRSPGPRNTKPNPTPPGKERVLRRKALSPEEKVFGPKKRSLARRKGLWPEERAFGPKKGPLARRKGLWPEERSFARKKNL